MIIPSFVDICWYLYPRLIRKSFASIPGIGLGLHIAKTIIDEHGGWIRYQPGEGGGSVFEFFIPEHPKAEVCPETD